MDFAYSLEQNQFRQAIQSLLASRPAHVGDAGVPDQSYDADLWRLLCEMDVLGLPVPEEYGGAGFGLVESAVAVSEIGRTLTRVPLLPSVCAIEAILRLGGQEQRRDLLGPVLRGDVIATIGISSRHDISAVATLPVASVAGSGHSLTGRVRHVMHADIADLFILPAVDSGGQVALYVVESAEAGVTVSGAERSFDPTRPVGEIQLDNVSANRLGGKTSPADLLELLDVMRAVLAIDMTGAARGCLESAVAYARERRQFNRTIGSFQAIKHLCAQMAVELDAAEAASDYAIMVAADRAGGLPAAALIAKAQASETLTLCAHTNLQIHGGMGFTWEHDAHLYVRRAKTTSALLGSAADNYALLADLVVV